MEIGTLTFEIIQKLLKERDQLNGEVDELRKSTPMSFWNKDLDSLDAKLDEARQKMQDKRMNGPAASAMETVHEVVNPKGKARAKKAPTKKGKLTSTLRDEDDDKIRDLKDRLAAYNLESSPDQSEVMEVEVPQKQAKKKPPSRKKGLAGDKDENSINDDEEFEVEVVVKNKGGRKPAECKAKAAKPPVAPAATKKRGPAASSKQSQMVGQKLITNVSKPAENDGISPEKKLRKMRASPFNKKSGSMLGRVARPQRAKRTRTTYVLSDSESDEASDDDSEFNEDED